MFFSARVPSPLNRVRQSFQQIVLGKPYTHMQDLTLSTKTNSKCTKDFNMKPKTIQPLEENSGGTSLAVQWLRPKAFTVSGVSSIPGQGTKIPPAMQHSQNKENMVGKASRHWSWHLFLGYETKGKDRKIKKLLCIKRHYQSNKATYRTGENICKSHTWHRVYIQNMQRTPTTSHTHTHKLKHGQRTVFKCCKWAYNHVKRCSTSLIIRKSKSKSGVLLHDP